MSRREILLPWVSQPQEAVGVNWAHPITRGLIEAYNWGASARDVVLGLYPSTDYAVPTVGPAGRGVTFSAEKHVITGKAWAGATEWTFLVLALPGTAKTAAVSFGNGSGGAGQSYLTFNTNSSFSTSVGDLGFGSGPSSGSSSITAVSGGIVSYPAVYVGVQSDQRRVYRDGVLLGTGASGSITVGGSGHVTCMNGIQGYTSWGATGSKYFLAMIWGRGLSSAEVAEIGRDPWQLFESRRIWVPVSAASGPPTLAAIAASNLTASGARLTVTV